MPSPLRILVAVFLLSLLVSGCGSTTSPSGTTASPAPGGSPSPPPSPGLEAENQQVVVQLNPLNNSGEAGTATLRTEPAGTTVNITILSGYPGTASPPASPAITTSPLGGVQQPAAIYQGTCAHLSPTPAYPLMPITYQAGSTPGSRSRISAQFNTLTSQDYSIIIQRSASDTTPVSCGDIRTRGVPVSPGASPVA